MQLTNADTTQRALPDPLILHHYTTVQHQLFALRALLQATMRQAPHGIRAIARVGGSLYC
jgi:hypothetical protein